MQSKVKKVKNLEKSRIFPDQSCKNLVIWVYLEKRVSANPGFLEFSHFKLDSVYISYIISSILASNTDVLKQNFVAHSSKCYTIVTHYYYYFVNHDLISECCVLWPALGCSSVVYYNQILGACHITIVI